MSGASPGAFFSEENLLEHNDDFDEEDIQTSLEYYCDAGILEEQKGYFCPFSDTLMEMDEDKGLYYCDTCCKHVPSSKADVRNGYAVHIPINKPKKEFEDFKELPEFNDLKKRLLLGIPRFFHALKKVPPIFIKEAVAGSASVKEEDFRDEMLRSVSFVFDTEGEAIRGGGRSDLIISGPDVQLDRVIGEFKVWGRNDFKDVVDQLLKYFTQFEDVGFIFLVNDKKRLCILKEYSDIAKKSKGYIKNSYRYTPLLNNESLKHFLTMHKIGAREVYVYHFIFDIYQP